MAQQQVAAQSRSGYVQVPAPDYPYLLSYLEDRFGSQVNRAGNIFWATNDGGVPRQVAFLVSEGILFPGRSILKPEKATVGALVAQQKKKGRRVVAETALGHCERCLTYFTQDLRRGEAPAMEHEAEGEMHPVRNIGVLSWRKYVPWRKPLYQSTGWINPLVLERELGKSMPPEQARWLTDLRVTAFRMGKSVSVEKILEKGEDAFNQYAKEAAFAFRDAAEAEMCPHVKTTKPFVPFAVGGPDRSHGEIGTATPVTYGFQTFLSWKVVFDGHELSYGQKMEVAERLELVLPFGPYQSDGPEPFKVGLVDAAGAAVADAAVLGAEEEPEQPEAAAKKEKEHWQVRRKQYRQPRSWRDRDARGESIRRVATPGVVVTPVPSERPEEEQQQQQQQQQQPSHPQGTMAGLEQARTATEAKPDPEEARKAFFERFNLVQADIEYEREDGGLIKATKILPTAVGMERLEFFNVQLMPQRLPYEKEWHPDAMQVARELAEELGGRVVVTEQRSRGMKSLAVNVADYTVRVASERLSPPSGGAQ